MWKWIWNNLSNIDSIVSIAATILSGVLFIGGSIIGLIISILKLKLKCNQYKYLNLPVDSQVKQAMKYYVPTRGQNIDPCTEEEYSTRHSFVSIELVKLFIRNIFKSSEMQYFIVLADSGMGKTTFLLKLFFEYYKKIFKKYDIVFVPLSLSSSLERVRSIENKSTTILLLDGFDEDKHAMEDYTKRLRTICDETELFYKVVITCRTQFFPDRDSEPKYAGKIKFGVGNKNVEFIKYYISPFSDRDIQKYLKKKYKFFYRRKKRLKAERLVKRCPRLMMRPMLLNYIDYLINDNQFYEYTYQIYDVLIQKWIERETIPNDILYSFTNKLALLMFAEKRQLKPSYEFEKICKDFDLRINPIEAKSRSLLNRTADGLYKFAHKSIYEYILSKNALENIDFREKLVQSDFIGLDMASLFFKEMCEEYIKTGKYQQCHDLSYMQVTEKCFENYNFSGCRMVKCRFMKCQFSNCAFEDIDANEIEFINCKLDGLNFNGAHLMHAVFSGSELISCKFIESNLTGSNFTNAPDGRTKMGSGCDFTNAKLIRANFSGMHLNEFGCIKTAELTAINMLGAKLYDIDFLCGKDLRAAILKDAEIINCKMNEINFNDCDFTNVYVKNTFFSKSYFSDTILINGTFVDTEFSEIEMPGANFKHSDFTNCIFCKSNLKQVDFSECKLKTSSLYMNKYNELDVRFLKLEDCDLDEDSEGFFDRATKSNIQKMEDQKKISRMKQLSN